MQTISKLHKGDEIVTQFDHIFTYTRFALFSSAAVRDNKCTVVNATGSLWSSVYILIVGHGPADEDCHNTNGSAIALSRCYYYYYHY